jgi:5-methylcytosine-specific restriction protein B
MMSPRRVLWAPTRRKESLIGSRAQPGAGLTISFLAFVNKGSGRRVRGPVSGPCSPDQAGGPDRDKASFVKKRVPFDVGGKPVSVMRIKAPGTVLDNAGDGRTVKVAWDPPAEPRDWYFYTYRTTIVEADKEAEDGRRLIDFTFYGAPQDYAWWLAQPYWLEKYGVKSETISVDTPATPVAIEDEEIAEEESPYTIDDIIADGCFLTSGELAEILDRWRLKMNLILQGPPGTGKTWLAKRLGFALAGSNDRETARSRLRVVHDHA